MSLALIVEEFLRCGVESARNHSGRRISLAFKNVSLLQLVEFSEPPNLETFRTILSTTSQQKMGNDAQGDT